MSLPTVEIKEFDIRSLPMSCTCVFIGPPETGKCLAKGTKVLMYNGTTKPVEQLLPGQDVMGDDSKSRRIISIASGKSELFEITQECGTKYTVNKEHILTLSTRDAYGFLTMKDVNLEDYLGMSDDYKAKYKGVYKTLDFKLHVPSEMYNLGLAVGRDYSVFIGRSRNGRTFELPDFPEEFVYTTQRSRFMFLDGLKKACGVLDQADVVFKGLLKVYIQPTQLVLRTLGMRYSFDDDSIRWIDGAKYNQVYETNNIVETSISIRSVGEGDYYGFVLDTSTNCRFVLHDGTITHNTSLMQNLCYYLRDRYPVGRLFMGTDANYKTYCNIFHPLYVTNHYDEEEEKRYILRQRECIAENGDKAPINYGINILDDCSDDPTIYKSKIIRGLFKNGSQHWHNLFMLGSQYAIDFPPDVRKSISYVFLGREPNDAERQKLYKNFGGICGTYDHFCDLMDAITGDYTFLVIKMRSKSNELSDNIFWIKTIDPKTLGNWKFGCKEYRKWAEERYNTEYRETIEI